MKTVKLRLDIGRQNDEPVPNVAQPQTLLRDTCPIDWPSNFILDCGGVAATTPRHELMTQCFHRQDPQSHCRATAAGMKKTRSSMKSGGGILHITIKLISLVLR